MWTLVTARLNEIPEDWARWVVLFDDLGIRGTIQTDDPPTIGGYSSEPEVVQSIVAALNAAGAAEVTLEEVPEEAWEESWKKFFVARPVGQKFLIRPEWEPHQPTDRTEIVLNPGQAFGTGDHPTTRMCLELLEELELNGKSVLDVGCGSGILSVAACKVGAANVIGLDNDPISVESAHENLARNHCHATIHLGDGFAAVEGQNFDVVVSNIISATLIRLAPNAARSVVEGGFWVLSGVIESNWPEVKLAAERNGFTFIKNLQENDWIAAIFRH